jgi:hypothetical protein
MILRGAGSGVWGKGLAGNLEAVEEDAGALGVELVGGEAADDLVEGGEEFAAVGGGGQGEASACVVGGSDGGAAGGVVEVAEELGAEGGGATGVAVGEDVGAVLDWHGVGASPRVLFGLGF